MRGRLRGALLAALLALGSGLAAAKGPLYLWEVRAPEGGVKAWLFGTVHVCDAACFPLPAEVRAALAAADTLALELDPQDPRLAARMSESARLPAGQSLNEALPPALRPRLAQAAARLGVSVEALQPFKPWLVATLLSLRAAQMAGYRTDQGVDLWLAAAARRQGLQTVALESVERQLEALEAGGEAAQLANLAETVRLIESGAAAAFFSDMVAAWRRGDAARLDRLVREEAATPDMAPMLAELLEARNQEMAQQIAARIAAGERPFVAVGAGHFGGAGGLLVEMTRRGFQLRQVEAVDD